MGKSREKYNLFGTNEETWGQRLANAICGHSYEYGILGCFLTEVTDLLKAKLSEREFEIAVRCFGINAANKRETQKAVAASLSIAESQMRSTSKKVVEKINRTCGPDLNGLMLKPDEVSKRILGLEQDKKILHQEVERLRKQAVDPASFTRLQQEAKNARNAYAAEKAKREKFEAELAKLVASVEKLKEERRVAINEKAKALSKYDAIVTQVTNVITATIDFNVTLETFDFSAETMNELTRAHIVSVEALLKRDSHSLRRLGVSNKAISEVMEKLRLKGFELTA